MNGPTVDVVLVSRNTRELLRGCLEALRIERDRSRAVISATVVDAASTDGSAEMARAFAPWVRVIPSVENLGFTRGNNWGLRVSRATYALLLNPDTIVSPGTIDALVAHLASHPAAAAVGPRLRYGDGADQPSRRRFPSRLSGLVEATVFQRWLGWLPEIRRYYVEDAPPDAEQSLDWLVGACILVRVAALRQVGLFDERFFMYSEEVDLCRRLRRAGWGVAYVPDGLVVHLEGRSSEQNALARDIHFHESRARYYAKHFGGRWSALVRLAAALHFAILAMEEVAKLLIRPSSYDLRRERIARYARALIWQASRLAGLAPRAPA